jgi:tetratricopeptide (TPR) repeat protein
MNASYPVSTDMASRRSKRRVNPWWPIGLIVLAGALAYANSLSGPFVFDDRATVLENTSIRDLWSPRVFAAHREVPTAGRPLVNVSHAINYAAGGVAPLGYHVLNLAVHLLCGVVLFGCVRRTLEMPRVPERVRRWSTDIALASALIWTVRPLNSEVVDYITQRSESMMALFFLATVYAGARAAVSPARARMWSGTAVASCALGMMCKESMVTAPLAVWLYDAVFVSGSTRSALEALRRRWPLYLGLASTWLILAIMLWSGPRMYSAGFSTKIGRWTYLLNQTVMIARYFRLAVWPRGLVVAYGPAGPLTLRTVWPYAAIVGLAVGATIFALFRWPLIGFTGAWVFLTLAPTSSVVPIATEVGAERRMYLPLAALIPLGVVLAKLAVQRLEGATSLAGPAPRRARRAFTLTWVAVAALLAALTIQRNREYATPLGLAETVLARRPTPFAHTIVGTQLAVAGRHPDAIAELRMAAPGYTLARYYLGGELFNQGALDEATAQLQEFVKLEPSLAEAVPARTMIGRAEMLGSKVQEAIEEFRQVLAMTHPGDEAHTIALGFLADALFSEHRFADAIPEYRAYAAGHPGDVGAFINLGVSLAQIGKPMEAAEAFQRAIQLDPSNAAARRDLAVLQEDLHSTR